jgi:signal transduction histidine kinase
LKPLHWAFWTLISFFCCLTLWAPVKASATATQWTTIEAGDAIILSAKTADISLSPQDQPPLAGWERRQMPQIALAQQAPLGRNGVISAWAKVRFDADQLGPMPLAIVTENNREQVTIYLNGVELFANAASTDIPVLGWNRTYLVTMPPQLLRAKGNEIMVRAASKQGFNLGLGTIQIGSFAALAQYVDKQTTKRIDGPRAANFAMLILAGVALLMWMARRSEEPILWLVLTAFFWFIRNYHFFAAYAPIDPTLFRDFSYYSIYFTISASLSFCVVFLNLPRKRLILGIMFGLAIGLSLGRIIIFKLFGNDALISLFALGAVVAVLSLMIKDAIKHPTFDHYSLIGVVFCMVVSSLHDIGRISNLAWWDGLGFHSQPYLGLILFIVFSVSVGRRFVGALTQVERLNVSLENRVQAARRELERSEAARRDLEIQSAVDGERERLMREMHDGIGSNLITALAVAQKQNESPGTVATLKRAITDLKITVDSLAPLEGDLVTLLGNFRHRIEPDLKLAGVVSVWLVEPCPPLPWLDAVNALQALRIIQEAIGNVLSHARATVLEIGCAPKTLFGRIGIQAVIKDNGAGFEIGQIATNGHGLKNMSARAHTLGGTLEIVSSKGNGTSICLWLPLERASILLD